MPTLNWVNDKVARIAADQVPFHLLKQKAIYGDAEEAKQNLIVHGDNLLALKALLPFYRNSVKCIYIDPPYNTGSAFEHYDDNLEHSQWLSMLYPRLKLLRDFLSEDGSIWISIDDEEEPYLKIIMDEIFGRKNRIATIVWQKRYSRENREAIGDSHEYIICYACNPEIFKKTRNLLSLTEKQQKLYKNPDNDPRGPWQSVSLLAQGYRPNQMYTIQGPDGTMHVPPTGRCWATLESEVKKLLSDNRLYFGSDGKGVPRKKLFLSEAKGIVPWTWWPHEEVGHTDEAKKEILSLFRNNLFDTPKPERLIQRILAIATNKGDLVLDSFLGSGTTAAVSHKLNRRYIGIEMGEHAETHCIPRLQKVIEGEQGGISPNVDWNGGGGFTYYELSEPVFDKYGSINQNVDFKTLASYIWQKETGKPALPKKEALLGIEKEVGIYLLFNGVLGDLRPESGNILNRDTLTYLEKKFPFEGYKIVYAEAKVGISDAELKSKKIIFKQIPYDING